MLKGAESLDDLAEMDRALENAAEFGDDVAVAVETVRARRAKVVAKKNRATRGPSILVS